MKLQLFYGPNSCAMVPYIALTEAGNEKVEALLRDEGWPERAAEALTAATGRRAWRNAVGHLAVDPGEWGWAPVPVNG